MTGADRRDLGRVFNEVPELYDRVPTGVRNSRANPQSSGRPGITPLPERSPSRPALLGGRPRFEAVSGGNEAQSQGVGDPLPVGALLSKAADPAGQVSFHLGSASGQSRK
jgi:hypothetical protein